MGRILSLGALVAGAAALLLSPVVGGVTAAAGSPPAPNTFSAPFGEPGPNCPQDSATFPMLPSAPSSTPCKPAAVNLMYLPNGKVLYWNGLEGMENVQANTVAEYGQVATCDQARLMTLTGAGGSWTPTTPSDAGCSTLNYQGSYLIPGLPFDGVNSDSDALFCSSQVFLYNGDILTSGGTDYYNEPNIPGTNFGVSELEGTKTTRLYDITGNRWYTVGDMNYGRWYPGLVTLPNGNLFIASGVTKLLKPVYPNAPTNSGTNVKQTETFDVATGKWTYNGTSADYSLPLYPRLHLLPDGKVYYDTGGQTFNPDGQSYDEVLWNFPAIYDPASAQWTMIQQMPGLGTTTPGFRGSGFSVMLPMSIDPKTGAYDTASFLSGGGVAGVTPGTYLATNSSEISTVTTSGGADTWSNQATGSLNNARWYSTAVVLPDESVMAFSGATADEVVAPGTAMPVKQAERYDPATGTWTAMATATEGRTYHNTGMLLPDGSVLVGGHSPINFMYSREETLPGGFSNNFRDYTFEIYYPPYWNQPRPEITSLSDEVLQYGHTFSITTHDSTRIKKVLLVRNPAITHLVDADQRTVELPFTQTGDDLHVQMPSNPAVLPPGPYYLFIDSGSSQGLVPSTAAQLFVQPAPRLHGPPSPAPMPTGASTSAMTVTPQVQAAAAKVTAAAHESARLAAATTPELPAPLLPLSGLALLAGGTVGLGVRRARRRLGSR